MIEIAKLEKEYSELSEDEKRIYQRKLTKKSNYSLNKVAKDIRLFLKKRVEQCQKIYQHLVNI